jgi:cobalt-zinc-cadmium efflux system outer membrane protein
MGLSLRFGRVAVAAAFSVFAVAAGGVARSAADDSSAVLRLADAQAAAVRARPEFVAAAAEARALEGAERQASLRPNPEVTLTVEDVGGTGAFQNTHEAQTTLSVFQPIELGGDRRARTAVAAGHRALASFDAQARRLDVLAETATAFVAVLIAQEELHHAEELIDLATRERGAVSERVRAGAALAVDETRARFAEEEVRIHGARGRGALEAARMRLAASWGDAEPSFERAEDDLLRVSPPPPLADLVRATRRTPISRASTPSAPSATRSSRWRVRGASRIRSSARACAILPGPATPRSSSRSRFRFRSSIANRAPSPRPRSA